jgi:hypothetical protein
VLHFAVSLYFLPLGFVFGCLACFLAVSPVCRFPVVWLSVLFGFYLAVGVRDGFLNSKTKKQRPFAVAVCLFVLSVYYSLEKLSIYSRLWL